METRKGVGFPFEIGWNKTLKEVHGKKRQCVKHNLVQMHEVLGSKGMRQFQFRATQEAICPFPLRARGCGCGISLVACAISLINLVGLSAHEYARCTSMYCTRISLCSWLAMNTQLKKKRGEHWPMWGGVKEIEKEGWGGQAVHWNGEVTKKKILDLKLPVVLLCQGFQWVPADQKHPVEKEEKKNVVVR